jgi:hypothetical protein
MTKTRVHFFRKYPLFVVGLPLFFVLHGFTENYDLVPIKDAILLTGVYIGYSFILLVLFRFLYKNWLKAGFASFLLMASHFFFGAIHDELRKLFPGTWITRYVFILPVLFCLLVLALVLLKKRNPSLKTTFFLNVSLLLLLLMDTGWLISKQVRQKKNSKLSNQFIPCLDCKKPNIYLIITDEYAGSKELKDLFSFDNSAFENELSGRGFHVVKNARSNYNFTPFSMASLLSMDYLKGVSHRSNELKNRDICYQNINHNDLVRTLKSFGYDFINQSLFTFADEPVGYDYHDFYLTGKRLITAQTLTGRLKTELAYHLTTTFKFDWAIKNFTKTLTSDIQKKYANTIAIAGQQSNKPRLIYTHFVMPHYPYLYDKDGREVSFEQSIQGERKDLYLGFLQYCNRLCLSLVDSILKKDLTNPIILLMSDHGFTKFGNGADQSYHFQNMVNIYFPGQDYSKVPDSLSNVNVFRVLLNTQFRQQLPLLKDSTFFLQEY